MNNAIPTNMAEGNTLKSYLVSIGVNFDQEKLKDIQNKLKNFANMMKQAFLKPVEAIKNFASKFVENFKKPLETVKNFTGKMSKAFTDINKKIKAFMQTMQKAFSVVTGFASSVISASVAVGKFMNNLAKQDLALDNFSRRMGVSKKTAREFKSAVDSLGASVEEIQFNPELLKQYKDLVADGRKMAVAGDYDKAMANVRSLGFEFVRLKNEANYVFQWVGYYLTKYLAGPMKAAKKYFQGFNEWIIKNTPQISAKIAEVMARIADVFGSVFKFFGKVGTALSQWWSGQPTWVKNMMAGVGILGAIFLGAQNPLLAIGMAIAGIFLLIEDYQKWTEGKKSAFGKIWEAITKACQKVKPVIEDWKNKAIKWFGEVKDWFVENGPAIQTFWSNFTTWVGEACQTCGEVIQNLISAFDELTQKIGSFFDRYAELDKKTGKIKVDWAKGVWEISTGQFESAFREYQNQQYREKFFNNSANGNYNQNVNSSQDVYNVPKPANYNEQTDKYDDIINDAGTKIGVSQNLIKGVIFKESSFNSEARGKNEDGTFSGAEGLMQLNRITQKHLGVKNAFNPKENIFAGTRYLKELLNKFNGDERLALIAYLNGPTAIQNILDKNNGSLTDEYIKTHSKEFVEGTIQYYKDILGYKKQNLFSVDNANYLKASKASTGITGGNGLINAVKNAKTGADKVSKNGLYLITKTGAGNWASDNLKEGASLARDYIAKRIYQDTGRVVVLTAGNAGIDGSVHTQGSGHYRGEKFDFVTLDSKGNKVLADPKYIAKLKADLVEIFGQDALAGSVGLERPGDFNNEHLDFGIKEEKFQKNKAQILQKLGLKQQSQKPTSQKPKSIVNSNNKPNKEVIKTLNWEQMNIEDFKKISFEDLAKINPYELFETQFFKSLSKIEQQKVLTRVANAKKRQDYSINKKIEPLKSKNKAIDRVHTMDTSTERLGPQSNIMDILNIIHKYKQGQYDKPVSINTQNPSNAVNISAINITINANTDNPQELARQVAENTTVALQDKMQYIGYSRNFGYA